MNKKELVDILSEKTNLNKTICKQVLDETIKVVKDCFYYGTTVYIKNFGKFGYKEIKSRKRYIPSIKDVRYEKQKLIPKFTPSKNFYGKLL